MARALVRFLPSVPGRIARLARGWMDAVWPPRCLVCDGEAWDGALPGLCARCGDRLPRSHRPCRRCGAEPGRHVAAACGLEAIDEVVAPLRYLDGARALVLALKFHGKTPAAVPLGALLADAVVEAGVPGDLVVPVPLSARRQRTRGHNQADELARPLARATGVPRDARALVRRRDIAPQSGLSRSARARNPRGAFAARRERVEGRCVLLVDDVLTTGATASACARALRRAGAARVVLAVACRA